MNYAYVTTNLLDLWNKPEFNSERLSQLFFGDVVQFEETNSGYAWVSQPDGYTGWADIRFLRSVKKTQVEECKRLVKHVVAREKTHLIGNDGSTPPSPHFLFYGTSVCIRSVKQEVATCVLPDGSTCRLRIRDVKSIVPISGARPTGAQIVREAKKFLGVPYLWGGVSPTGFDCSGLVRTVLARFGIYVPRDTKDQIKVGAAIDRASVRTGDLLFFKRHVGFALGRDRIIHSSVGGSGVRISSLTPGTDDYRSDLHRDFATARRIL